MALLALVPVFSHAAAQAESDLRALILDALAAGQKTVTVPKGVYRLKAEHGSHLRFANLEDVTINAKGVQLICEDPARAIEAINCRNLKIKGLSIDYDPLPYTQGEIISVDILDGGARKLKIRLFDGYPPAEGIERGAFETYCPDTHLLRTPTYYMAGFENLGDGTVEITKAQNQSNPAECAQEEVGDIVVMSRPGFHAITSDNCENLTYENVTIFSSHSMAFVEGNCVKSNYIKCKVVRRPQASDCVKRAYPRLRSSNADGFHCKFAAPGPQIINCEVMYNGDDSVAISGTYHPAVSASGNKVTIVAPWDRLYISPGDRLEIFFQDGSVNYEASVVDIEGPQDLSSKDAEWFLSLPSYIRSRVMHEKQEVPKFTSYTLTLDRKVEIPRGSYICSSNKKGDGFLVRGGKFGGNRSRGLIIKAGNGTIEKVTIENCWMESIKLAPEWYWFEAGHAENLVVRNCRIKAGCGPAIGMHSTDFDGGKMSPAGANKNILFENNTIRYTDAPAVFITSVDGLTMKNCKVTKMPERTYGAQPPQNTYERQGNLQETMLINVKNVKNEGK